MTMSDRTALVARRIRAARRHRGWTLNELAIQLPEQSKLTAKLLSRVELGTRELSIAELSDVASALDIVPEYLIRDGELCTGCGQEIEK